jgi:hypothetical protein
MTETPASTPAPSSDPDRLGWLPVVVGAALVVGTAVAFLVAVRSRAGVWLSAPLDDTFIHFQYAKQLARGHLLQFNDGDSPTTGATSLLYLFVLAPGWICGLRGELLLVWAWIANALLLLVSALALHACVRRLSGSRPFALAAMAVYLLSGPMLWGAYSHMEIALFSALSLLALRAALVLAEFERVDPSTTGGEAGAGARRARRELLLLGGLLAFTRPEGMLMAGGVTLWLAGRRLAGGGRPGRGIVRTLLGLRGEWAPLLAAAACLLLYLLLTGRLETNAAVKSHLDHLAWEPWGYLETTLGWLPMTLEILVEKWPTFLEPVCALLLLLGLVLLASERRLGAGVLVVAWFALLTLFYAFAMARRDHFDRYYLPYFGLSVVVVFFALARLAARLRREDAPRAAEGARPVAAAVAFGVLLLFLLPQTHFWAKRFGDNCRDLALQHFKVAEWLRENVPEGTRIAVNDAGAIPYLSGLYAYDIVGLAHNAFYRAKRDLPGSNAPVLEALIRLERRPEYLVVYPEWIPDLHRMHLFEEVRRFPLVPRSIVANESKLVYRARWDLLVNAASPPAALLEGRRVRDQVNVADLVDERRHAYRVEGRRGAPEGIVREEPRGGGRFLVEGGRVVPAGAVERMRLEATPGRGAALVLRTAGPGALDLEVVIDGAPAGRWTAERPRGFGELRFLLGARAVVHDRLELGLRARVAHPSFRIWIAQ